MYKNTIWPWILFYINVNNVYNKWIKYYLLILATNTILAIDIDILSN